MRGDFCPSTNVRSVGIAMFVSTLAALSSTSFAQNACETSRNDCCVAGGFDPGCNDQACCELVCAADPFCCSAAWDSICGSEAVVLCGELCGGRDICGTSTNECCAAGIGPGCNDVDCCNIVCIVDVSCCAAEWDVTCASIALVACGQCENSCDVSCPVPSSAEREVCGEDTNGGCISDSGVVAYEAISAGTLCGTFWAEDGARDSDWYSFSVTEGTLVSWSVSAKVAVHFALRDQQCPPFTYTSADYADCPAEGELRLGAGAYTVFIAPNYFDGLPCGTGEKNIYLVSLAFSGSCGSADLNDDGKVDAADLAALLGDWGRAGSADLDASGVVDAADLAILLGAWGTCG